MNSCTPHPGNTGTLKALTGKLYVIGSEPFTRLVLEIDPDKILIISKESPVYPELWKRQGQILTLKIRRHDNPAENQIYVIDYQTNLK